MTLTIDTTLNSTDIFFSSQNQQNILNRQLIQKFVEYAQQIEKIHNLNCQSYFRPGVTPELSMIIPEIANLELDLIYQFQLSISAFDLDRQYLVWQEFLADSVASGLFRQSKLMNGHLPLFSNLSQLLKGQFSSFEWFLIDDYIESHLWYLKKSCAEFKAKYLLQLAGQLKEEKLFNGLSFQQLIDKQELGYQKQAIINMILQMIKHANNQQYYQAIFTSSEEKYQFSYIDFKQNEQDLHKQAQLKQVVEDGCMQLQQSYQIALDDFIGKKLTLVLAQLELSLQGQPKAMANFITYFLVNYPLREITNNVYFQQRIKQFFKKLANNLLLKKEGFLPQQRLDQFLEDMQKKSL